MKQIYVAGSASKFKDVREIQQLVQEAGHRITYDWTKTVEEIGDANEHQLTREFKRGCAIKDRLGVQEAHIVIALMGENLCGTLIEIGIALDWGAEVWIIGEPVRDSIFFELDQVTRLADDLTEIRHALEAT